jgi:hypothetical protein
VIDSAQFSIWNIANGHQVESRRLPLMWTHFLWTYVAGPVAALLPVRWRKALLLAGRVQWERAAAMSGFLEIVVAIVGLGYWYMFEMTLRVSQIMNASTNGRIPAELGEHQVQGAALMLFYMNPLTWILFYFFFEGAVRLCGAAFAENVLGTMPLYVLERLLFLVRYRREARPREVARRNVKSFVESVREKLMVAKLKEVADELHYTTSGTEETLEIGASRRKEEWVAPKIVRVDEVYYRLEKSTVEKGVRPFWYQLRRLDAGVPGRSVILYRKGGAAVKQ